MANKEQPNTNKEQKVQTKYDRKMEDRKKKEAKEKRQDRLMKIGAIVICVAIVVVIAASVTISILNKKAATKDVYAAIGTHEITKLEYDYYYNTTANSYVTTYASILQYMGLDTAKPYEEQQYSDNMTWKDMFDQMTVEQISQTKALADDAAANNFAYDDTEDYQGVVDSIKAGADAGTVSIAEYYKNTYGNYATQSNTAGYIKEGLFAAAYYDNLITNNAPTEQEVKDYYTENAQNYDKVDYKSFAIKADIAEDAEETEIDRAMLEAKKKADAMLEARQGGTDFRELCLQNASEEEKADYEDAEQDASLSEGKYYSDAPAVAAGWLYEEGRADGDITVIEDTGNNQYYVIEFNNRYFDEADNATISDTIARDRVAEYIAKLMESYTVTDIKGDLKYLTIDMSAAETEKTEE